MENEVLSGYYSTFVRYPDGKGVIRVTNLHDGKPLPTEVLVQACKSTGDHPQTAKGVIFGGESFALVVEELPDDAPATHAVSIARTNHEPLRTTPAR